MKKKRNRSLNFRSLTSREHQSECQKKTNTQTKLLSKCVNAKEDGMNRNNQCLPRFFVYSSTGTICGFEKKGSTSRSFI